MMMMMITTIFHLILIISLFQLSYSDEGENINLQICLKGWQNPILTIPTLSSPSAPLKCYPDDRICERHGAECQFSLKKFEYICCKDNDDLRIPICPRYHDTLHTLCGKSGNGSRCPKSYECMRARNYPNIELCCRSNDNLKYEEPETTFNDHFITPDILPYPPKNSINISYSETMLTEGQLISKEQINDLLERPPQLSGYVFSDNLQYTVIIIGFPFRFTKNTSIDYPSTVYLFENDIKPVNGKIILQQSDEMGKQIFYGRKSLKELENSLKFTKCCTVPYKKPGAEIKSKETYTMVLVVLKQKKAYTTSQQNVFIKKGGREKGGGGRSDIISPTDEPFYIKKFLKQYKDIFDQIPVAGTFYGIRG